MTDGSLHHLRGAPSDCVTWLNEHPLLFGTTLEVARDDPNLTMLTAEFAPHPDLVGYPIERVNIVIRADGAVYAVPIDPDQRPWEHRYPPTPLNQIVGAQARIDWHFLLGALCLWYPADPPHLRWSWADGIDNLLRLVQKHLWSEEYFRRTHRWPGEDAPHGRRADGQPHPVQSPELRRTA